MNIEVCVLKSDYKEDEVNSVLFHTHTAMFAVHY